MKIRFSTKRIPICLIYFQLLYVCFVRLLVDFGLPDSITLLCDAVNICLLVCLLIQIGKTKRFIKSETSLLIVLGALFLLGTISALIYGFSIILWIWDIRNFGRFFLFLIACSTFLDMDDYFRFKNGIIKLGHINICIILIQFFIFNLQGDSIGGLFGTADGVANTWLNTFLVVLFSLTFSEYLSGKQSLKKLGLVFSEEVIIAVIAELKYLFIEIAILVILGLFLAKKTKRLWKKTMLLFCLCVVILSIAIPYLYKMYPMFANFFSFDVIYRTAISSYTGNGDLGRLTAIGTIITRIFKGDIVQTLIGIGIGNAEYSGGIKMFQSGFYKIYYYTKYFWFTDAVVMIQTGLIGIIMFLSIFFIIIKKSINKLKNKDMFSESYMMCFFCGIIAILLFVYNISLNTESAYILYAFLSFALISRKSGEGKI